MFPNLVPAVVDSYDQVKRTCRIRIDGITNGGDCLPEAEILYPIGDKSQHTELEILSGDLVWVAFQNGDPRYPIICGSRAKNTANSADWRKYHHANIELDADGEIHIKAGVKVHVEAPDVIVDATNVVVNATDVHVTATNTKVDSTNVEVNATDVKVNASSQLKVTSPQSIFTGKVTVQGLFSYTSGMAGSGFATGGGGASAKINGSIELIGGDITADGVGLKSHHHIEHDGYNTSNAKA